MGEEPLGGGLPGQRAAPQGLQGAPRRVPAPSGKFKKGDSTKDECANAQQLVGEIMPIGQKAAAVERQAITAEMRDRSVFMQLRQARADKKWYGKRNKKE